MSRYKFLNFYVNTEVEIQASELFDQIDNDDLIEELLNRDITPQEKTKLLQGLGTDVKSDGIQWSLYDDLKMNVIKEAFNKYTLEQLEEKLK